MRNSILVKLPVLACLLALPWVEAAGADPEGLWGIFRDKPTAISKQEVWDRGAKDVVKKPGYASKAVETKDFEGFFLAAKDTTELWVFSDDGVDVHVTDYSLPNPQPVVGLDRKDEPQHLPSWQKESLWKVDYPFGANKIYRLRIEYRNKFYWGESDIDGCTLFATNGGGKIVRNGVDLAVEGMMDFQRNDPGALVVRRADGNNAPRKKIILAGIDDVLLSCSSGKVKFFTTAYGDAEVNLDGGHKEYARADLPKSLYVQGHAASETMADVQLTLTLQSDGARSAVRFTVVWVGEVAVAFSGEMARDNDKREFYETKCTEAEHDLLGLQKFKRVELEPGVFLGPWIGWGHQIKGSVAPAQFSYPIIYPNGIYLNSNLCLARDCQSSAWRGDGQPLEGAEPTQFSETVEGNDTHPRECQDHDPTDSDPPGAIYDWDAPGLCRDVAPVGEVRRYRANFKVFARVKEDHGPFLRASAFHEFFVRFSMKQLTEPHGDNWIVIDPPDVPGDKKAEDGPPQPVTWDLK